jgi:outer membrane protein OmpU
MKKLLLATSFIAASTGFAAAEVAVSGYGRFGLVYNENTPAGFNDTIISSRLRINIDGKTTTDGGVELGARLRMQYVDGDEMTAGNAAKFYGSYNGLRVEVGNVETAFDSAALIYDSEMGFEDSSFGDPQGAFYAYDSNTYGAGNGNRTGLAVSYSAGAFSGMISYVTPDQVTSGSTEETAINLAYASGPFAVSAAAYSDGAGIAGNDGIFLGAAYTLNEVTTIGLNYMDEDAAGGRQITLYGNHTMGATTLRAYVSDLDVAGLDTAYGIGADYDLGGGARVSGAIESDFVGDMSANLGLRFNF